jgi:hypothetical protein
MKLESFEIYKFRIRHTDIFNMKKKEIDLLQHLHNVSKKFRILIEREKKERTENFPSTEPMKLMS